LFVLPAILAVFVTTAALGDSTIDPVAKYAWAENAGWCNFQGDGTHGVGVGLHYLLGYVWMENAGWLSLGTGPKNGVAYSEAAGDTGVNNDGHGNLSGYAWGENIGWVVFNPAGSAQQVVVGDDGQFAGYAWSENIGWISMNSGYGVLHVYLYRPASAPNWMLY
jgi:hypothetical protein